MNNAPTSLVLQASIASAFAAPPQKINQPGTTQTLDPLDGRIVWSPYQVGNFVWFTHGIAINIFLNWAYTDTPNGIPTSVTVDGVKPGGGVPNLIGTGVVLVQGFKTTTNFRFGDYSSVAIDPTSVNGCTAVIAQQYFISTGQWRTRLARLGFC